MKYETPQMIPLKGNALEYDHLWEDQFKNPEKIEVYGGEMDVIDLKPEKEEVETPVVYLRGWDTTAEIYKTNLKEIATTGRRALITDAPAGIESQNLSEEEREKLEGVSDLEIRKVAAFIKTVEQKGIDKVDLVTHSEGAIYGAYAALLRPDLFRSLTLTNPAGMIGPGDKGINIAGRAILDFSVELGAIYKNFLNGGGVDELKTLLKARSEAGKAIAENPVHIAKSVDVIAVTQIQETLKVLHDLGIKIFIIAGVDDQMFSMEKIQKTVNESGGSNFVDGFLSVVGTHEKGFLDPVKMTKATIACLNEAEKMDKAGKETEQTPENTSEIQADDQA